jgi:iron complex outermembrane receptor protein
MTVKDAFQNRLALRSFLLCGAAMVALASSLAPAAYAQDNGAGAAPADQAETVVVTGTSIRGVAPVGSNLVAVDREQIEATGAQTMQQLYTSLPLIASFGVSSKPSEGITGIESSPTIHNFGESSSASTLLLMNGRPIMPQGSLGVGDPSVIPSIAIERVDVMPDGDSAVYGSSAVAGVVNFITRKNFEGVNAQASDGMADQYQRASLGLLIGHSWDSGNVTLAYEYQSNSSLQQNARAFGKSADLRSQGGANFNTLFCGPASIAANSGSGTNIYLSPYTNPTIGSSNSISAAGTAPCDSSGDMEYFPSRTTQNYYLDAQQTFGPIKADFETGFLYRTSMNEGPAGSSVGNPVSFSGTAFGPGGTGSAALGAGSINPFYQGSTATGTAASEFVRWNPSQLLGTEVPISKQGSIDAYENVYLTTNLFAGWEAELDQSASTNNDFTQTDHGYCNTCALLALNGTTNSAGSANNSIATSAVIDPFNLGNVASVTRVLNTSNALDVWDPPGTNKTSAQVLKEIMSDQTSSTIRITYNDVKLKFDGPIFDLPAGPLKVAFGVEYNQVNYYTAASSSNNTGSSQTGGANINQLLPQNVKSVFLEFAVPVVSEDMGIPLMQKLDLQIAGRIDDYSTTGTTRNPKLGFNWQIIDGLKMRGSYGTSFTAPNVTFVSGIATVSQNTTAFTIPSSHVNYPGSFCPNVGNTCQVGPNYPGITVGGPNPNLKPMTGRSYSAGIDFQGGDLWRPLEGLSGSLTYWKTFFYDGVTLASNIGAGYLTVPQLEPLLTLAPASGPFTPSSPEVLSILQSAKLTSALPQNIYFIAHQIRVNGFSIIGDGMDISVNYDLPTDNFGEFNWGYDATWKFDWWEKGGPHQAPGTYTSYLNGRFNTSVIFAEALEGRMHLGWAFDPFIATLFWNYTAPYWVQTSSGPYASSPDGRPTGVPASLYSGGYQRVQANSTFDLNIDYKLPADWLDGWTNGTTFSLNVRDLFATRPPFFNFAGTCNGSTYCNSLDEFNGDPLQRVISFSLRKTF